MLPRRLRCGRRATLVLSPLLHARRPCSPTCERAALAAPAWLAHAKTPFDGRAMLPRRSFLECGRHAPAAPARAPATTGLAPNTIKLGTPHRQPASTECSLRQHGWRTPKHPLTGAPCSRGGAFWSAGAMLPRRPHGRRATLVLSPLLHARRPCSPTCERAALAAPAWLAHAKTPFDGRAMLPRRSFLECGRHAPAAPARAPATTGLAPNTIKLGTPHRQPASTECSRASLAGARQNTL